MSRLAYVKLCYVALCIDYVEPKQQYPTILLLVLKKISHTKNTDEKLDLLILF